MKVTFDIECTPAEARAFFGLPDLTPVHDLYIDRLKATITEGVSPADMEKLTRAWMPGVVDGFEQWQKLLTAVIPRSSL